MYVHAYVCSVFCIFPLSYVWSTVFPLYCRSSTIPTPTYLPVLNSVLVLISFLYFVSYIPWRPLSLLVHRLSISVHISYVIPNTTPVPIPTSLFYSNQFSLSLSYMSLLSVFFLFLSICSWICSVAYITF